MANCPRVPISISVGGRVLRLCNRFFELQAVRVEPHRNRPGDTFALLAWTERGVIETPRSALGALGCWPSAQAWRNLADTPANVCAASTLCLPSLIRRYLDRVIRDTRYGENKDVGAISQNVSAHFIPGTTPKSRSRCCRLRLARGQNCPSDGERRKLGRGRVCLRTSAPTSYDHAEEVAHCGRASRHENIVICGRSVAAHLHQGGKTCKGLGSRPNRVPESPGVISKRCHTFALVQDAARRSEPGIPPSQSACRAKDRQHKRVQSHE